MEEERIREMLEIAGKDMEFDLGTIKGLPGNTVYSIQNYDSPYDIEKQVFSFTISAEDFYALNIIEGEEFRYYFAQREYIFEVKTFRDNLIGLIKLDVILKNLERG